MAITGHIGAPGTHSQGIGAVEEGGEIEGYSRTRAAGSVNATPPQVRAGWWPIDPGTAVQVRGTISI